MLNIGAVHLEGLQVRNARGIAGMPLAIANVDTLGIIAELSAIARATVTVRPGQDTTIPLELPDVRRNSKLRALAATLYVADATAATPQATGVRITPAPGSATRYDVAVDGAVRPSAVTLRLKGGPVFWTHGGPLTESSYELPDFAAAANEYLDRLPPADGPITLELVLESATAGRVGFSSARYRHTLIRTESWPNEAEGTLRVDRTFELDYGALHVLPLAPVEGGARVRLHRVSLDSGGTVGAERLLGRLGEPGTEQATIGGDYAVAQRLVPDVAVRAAGVAAYLRGAAAARLYVELQPDAAGSPAADEPLARGELALPPTHDGWASALLDAPVDLPGDAPVWVVFRSIQGSARLGLEPAASDTTALRVSRGGPLWRSVAPGTEPAGLARLLYVPGPDNNSAAVELTAAQAGAPAVLNRTDPGAEPVTIDFDLPGTSAGAVTLVIRSRARGQVTIANVVQEYTLA
jgi:hypothetical protein